MPEAATTRTAGATNRRARGAASRLRTDGGAWSTITMAIGRMFATCSRPTPACFQDRSSTLRDPAVTLGRALLDEGGMALQRVNWNRAVVAGFSKTCDAVLPEGTPAE